MTIIKRKCYVSGRCPDTVNVNIGPVYKYTCTVFMLIHQYNMNMT